MEPCILRKEPTFRRSLSFVSMRPLAVYPIQETDSPLALVLNTNQLFTK